MRFREHWAPVVSSAGRARPGPPAAALLPAACCVSLGSLLPVSELVLRLLRPGPGAGLVPPGSVQRPGQAEKRENGGHRGPPTPGLWLGHPAASRKPVRTPGDSPPAENLGTSALWEWERGPQSERGALGWERGRGRDGGALDRGWVETRHRGREKGCWKGRTPGWGGRRFMEEKRNKMERRGGDKRKTRRQRGGEMRRRKGEIQRRELKEGGRREKRWKGEGRGKTWGESAGNRTRGEGGDGGAQRTAEGGAGREGG